RAAHVTPWSGCWRTTVTNFRALPTLRRVRRFVPPASPIRTGGGFASGLSSLDPAMARRDQRSPEAQAYRRLYKNARWRELRLRILARDLYTCRVCGRLEGRKGQMVVNHIRPHKG